MECKFLEKKINILTEKDGALYMLKANSINEIANAFSIDSSSLPANDARVFFATFCGDPINPYAYTDFYSCVQHIAELIYDDKYKKQYFSLDDNIKSAEDKKLDAAKATEGFEVDRGR